jgi:hypothetical protein
MPITFEQIKPGVRLRGLVAGADVEVITVSPGDLQFTVVYQSDNGSLNQRP